jgi:hypothetical protein
MLLLRNPIRGGQGPNLGVEPYDDDDDDDGQYMQKNYNFTPCVVRM